MSAEKAITPARKDRSARAGEHDGDPAVRRRNRHVFLTTQRTDLVESIAQTAEAIKRIDETTSALHQAFTAIQQNFRGRSARSSVAGAPA
jgi:hypothetical protein